jgi:transcriptional antiterminator RfaH
VSSKWYLVYAKPQREAVAREQLAQQGYTVFLPMVKQKRRIRGKRATRLEPFFPRYLFISLNKTDDNWSPIRSTVGVINLVRFGGLPAQVPDSVVDFLLAREQESLIVHPTCDFSKGDTVRVVSGPFEGVEALFSSSASDERAMILLRLANQHTLAQVNLSSIERVV